MADIRPVYETKREFEYQVKDVDFLNNCLTLCIDENWRI